MTSGSLSETFDPRVDVADVVFTFSFESLEDALRRGMGRPPDRLLTTLTEHPSVRRLLVADAFRSVPSRVRGSLSVSGPKVPSWPNTYRVKPVRLRRRDPTDLLALAGTYRAYEQELIRALTRRGLVEPALITFNPFVAAFCDLRWARSVTYYARDDWSKYPVQARLKEAHQVAILRIRERGHRVCAVSQVLLDRLDPRGRSRVVPNGIDPLEWVGEPAIPDWFDELPRPIAVYAGSLDGRLDADAVRQVANALGTGSVVLVGPVMDDRVAEAFRGLSNVHLPGRHSRRHVAGIIRTADVCLIPHARTELTEAMSPLKLFEYRAAGRPVVATDLPPIREVAGPKSVLVSDSTDWAAAVEHALGGGPASEHERAAFIRSNSWRARHEEVLGVALA